MMAELERDGSGGRLFLTLGELAERWRVSKGSIINYRKRGRLHPFTPPWSGKPLYPLAEIEQIENIYTLKTKEVMNPAAKAGAGAKGEPVKSDTNEQWRI